MKINNKELEVPENKEQEIKEEQLEAVSGGIDLPEHAPDMGNWRTVSGIPVHPSSDAHHKPGIPTADIPGIEIEIIR